MMQKNFIQRDYFIGGLALAHTIYTLGALILTHQAMLLFSFGSVGFAYRTLLISNQSSQRLIKWLTWAFWILGGLMMVHGLSVVLVSWMPGWDQLAHWNDNWSTMRGLDFFTFFILFGLNVLEEKKAQALRV